MSGGMTGLALGSVVGVAGFAALRTLAKYVERRAERLQMSGLAAVFRAFGWVSLLVGPIKGYFVLPLVMGY
ncbi:MAG: hypothetical protein ACT4N2_05270 [Hyphomicrobium sp.]